MGHFDLGPRISHPVSQLWIICKDCSTILHNERGQEGHRNYVNGFSERNGIVLVIVLSHFGTKVLWCPLHFESTLRFFYWFYWDQEIHEKFFSCFLRKNLFWGNLIFWSHFLMPHYVWSKLSQATVTIGSLKSQQMIKIFKQSGHDFSGKRFCGR